MCLQKCIPVSNLRAIGDTLVHCKFPPCCAHWITVLLYHKKLEGCNSKSATQDFHTVAISLYPYPYATICRPFVCTMVEPELPRQKKFSFVSWGRLDKVFGGFWAKGRVILSTCNFWKIRLVCVDYVEWIWWLEGSECSARTVDEWLYVALNGVVRILSKVVEIWYQDIKSKTQQCVI